MVPGSKVPRHPGEVVRSTRWRAVFRQGRGASRVSPNIATSGKTTLPAYRLHPHWVTQLSGRTRTVVCGPLPFDGKDRTTRGLGHDRHGTPRYRSGRAAGGSAGPAAGTTGAAAGDD